MKKNTKKLLLALYPLPDFEPRFVSRVKLRALVPELSTAGWLSLLTQGEKKGYLVTEKSHQGEHVRITSLGQAALKDVFPAFSQRWESWQGEWGSLLFIKPPAGDPNFRFLRSFLIRQGIKAVSRGTYLYPWPFPDSVLELSRSKYGVNVGISKISDWTISDFKAIMSTVYGISDLFTLYSGISSELDRLLVVKDNKIRLNYQSKNQIGNIFDRFLQIIAADPGFFDTFLPQDLSGRKILFRLQLLVDQS